MCRSFLVLALACVVSGDHGKPPDAPPPRHHRWPTPPQWHHTTTPAPTHPPTTKPPPPPIDCKCKSRSFLHDKAFYQIFDCPKPYEEAQQDCMWNMVMPDGSKFHDDGVGHLLWIEDKTEQFWVAQLLDHYFGRGTKFAIWLGLKRIEHVPVQDPHRPKKHHKRSAHKPHHRPAMDCSKFHFEWTSGAPFKFCPWGKGQPNNFWKPKENCAVIFDNFSWNDVECELPTRYICKRPFRGQEIDRTFTDKNGGPNQ